MESALWRVFPTFQWWRGRCGRCLVSLCGIPLLLIFRLGHYHEPWTGLALIWKDENLTRELEAALSAAREAGEVLRKGFGWQHSVSYKGEVDIVTEVDGQAERVIKEILLGAFPAYGMLAEESGRVSGQEDARWIVDPLDGTTNYAHGLPIFAVSIALQRAGEVVGGVPHPPMGEDPSPPRGGGGAPLNADPIGVSDPDEPIQALI